MRSKNVWAKWLGLSGLIAGTLVVWVVATRHHTSTDTAAAGPGHAPNTKPAPNYANANNPINHHPSGTTPAATNTSVKHGPSSHTLVLRNTELSARELLHRPDAILLANAVILTSSERALEIPEVLRAGPDPGAYIVQTRDLTPEQLQLRINRAGGSIVAYVPNNAYLVHGTPAVAERLRADPAIAAVLPYEPYFKLDAELLARAIAGKPLIGGRQLNALLFPDAEAAGIEALRTLGAQVLSRSVSPFGPVYTIRVPTNALVAVAHIPAVQWIAPVRTRMPANDLSRVRLGVAPDTTTTTNYTIGGLELTGEGVRVAVVDSGIDVTHPDLAGRVIPLNAGAGTDISGHGTHVAGIIASSGQHSPSNVIGSVAGADFRGKAHRTTLYSIRAIGSDSGLLPDAWLQEAVARTNALISNNSWYYAGANSYDMAAASYDAAVRDALPEVPGSQPVVFVFPASDAGSGNDNGLSGLPDSIMSPATAKNVITVGALEQPRNIEVEIPTGGETNTISFLGSSNSDSEVAAYSGRGNVGYWFESDYGRFKPDVVAPGSWVVSTRSQQWDTNSYYNPQYHQQTVLSQVELAPNDAYYDGVFIPADAQELRIYIVTNRFSPRTLPPLPICLKAGTWPEDPATDCQWSGLGSLTIPISDAEREQDLYFAIRNNTAQSLNFDVVLVLVRSNPNAERLLALQLLNDAIGPYYRYESGSSMAAAAVSGVLALMQQFFQDHGVTASPAMLKALLINGARSLGRPYDLCVSNTINFQGWGLVNLPATLHPALAGVLPGKTTTDRSSIWIFDQDPQNRALATGDRWTVNITVSPEAAQEPLRVTLVWTDPPGNPAVGLKLVNDLDLVVSNLDNPAQPVVYVGNAIPATAEFNEPWTPDSTNAVPAYDRVNNVENVFIAPPLGTNYQITVIAHRVHVNAVPENTNGIVQDFALVISCGDGAVTNALQIGRASRYASVTPRIMYIGPESNGIPILNQRVGANFPLTNKTDAPHGQLSQWNFYVLTNTFGYTNAAFITFMPPELGLRRMAARESDQYDASRPEGDIDLYVSTDPRLLELHPEAIANADKSLEQGGTEYVVYSNSTAGTVYYVGVKSEDQQAVEFGFLGVFSETPFAEQNERGTTMRAISVPVAIPDGSPDRPRAALVFCVNPYPMSTRRVVVTEDIQHEDFGDILVNLSHRGAHAVLHNHTLPEPNQDPARIYHLIYEDNNEMDARRSDGPGNLRDFIGTQAAGVWQLTVIDNAFTHTGTVHGLTIDVEKSMGTNLVNVILQPGRSYMDFVDVPANATNLVVAVSGNTQPLIVYIRRAEPPTATLYDKKGTVIPPGGAVNLSIYDTPPLQPGRYFYEVFNPSAVAQDIRILVTIEYELAPPSYRQFGSLANIAIKDNAVTYASLWVTNAAGSDRCLMVNGLDVGLLINHPRVADLVITLISPSGTRAVLFENRGWLDTNGLGTFGYALTNKTVIYSNNFAGVAPGAYGPQSTLADWRVLDGIVAVTDGFNTLPLTNKTVWLGQGVIGSTLLATGAQNFELKFMVSHAPALAGMLGWWPFDSDGTDLAAGHHAVALGNIHHLPGMVGNALYADGVGTSVEVPACPELDTTNLTGFSFEGWIYPSNIIVQAPVFGWGVSTNTATNSSVQLWISRAVTTNGGPGCITAILTDTNGTRYYIETPGDVLVSTQWQHIAFTYDLRSNVAAIYTNGVPVVITNLAATNQIEVRPAGQLHFGWLPGTTHRFAGGIDEFALYKRVLDPCEVQAIYEAGPAGKHGTAASTCPVTFEVNLAGVGSFTLTNGLSWRNTGVMWETSSIPFEFDGGLLPIIIRGLDPNLVLAGVELHTVVPTRVDGLLHFTDNTNLATVPIKFAETPFTNAVFPPVPIITNGMDGVAPGIYTNCFDTAELHWVVPASAVEVVADPAFVPAGTNYFVLGQSNMVACVLPTQQGKRYRLEYSVRGPGVISWWNGSSDPASGRARDLLGANHGELWPGAALNFSTNAFVGEEMLQFAGAESKIELGDPPNLVLTNQFTIEGWIMPSELPPTGSLAQIIFRGDFRTWRDPYYLAITPEGALRLHLEDTNDWVLDLDSPVGLIAPSNWWHVAAVVGLEPTLNERVAKLYVNGQLVAYTNPVPEPIGALDPAYSPGVAIGNRSRLLGGQPFRGYIDELTIYARALSSTELDAIYRAGSVGKADPTVPPEIGLARVRMYLDGVEIDDTYASNACWITRAITFTAQQSNSVVAFESILPGTLLTGLRLSELPPELYYMPEQPLSIFNGECAEGEWKLEIWDTRAGANDTNTMLLNWQISFQAGKVGVPAATRLVHAVTCTNTIAPSGIQYYYVDVPIWATMATNLILYATEPGGTNTLPLAMLHDPNRIPITTNTTLIIDPATANMTATLSITSAPVLVPGQRYYLAVTNPHPVTVEYAITVWFDITWLEPCIPTPSFVWQAGIPRYFCFNVPADFTTNGPPPLVAFRVSGMTTNLTVVLNQSPPLPDLAYHDYISARPCTNNELVLVVTNTTPFPLKPGTWFAGVFNSADAPVEFVAEVCFDTNRPVIIPLTNAVPFVVPVDSGLAAEPGPPRRVFFEFEITNRAPAALFELYELTGDAELVLQRSTLPGTAPYFAESYPLGKQWKQIVLRTNAVMPDLRGRWYLGVYNKAGTNIGYTINAALGTNGLLESTYPMTATITPAPNLPGYLLIMWNSVIGERYDILFASSLLPPINWTVVGSIIATTPLTTYVVPVPNTPIGLYRVMHVPAAEGIELVHDTPWTGTMWAGATMYFVVDVPDWAEFTTNSITASGPVNLIFNQVGSPMSSAGSNITLASGTTNATIVLGSNSVPPLIPGRKYWLAVQNTASNRVTFSIRANFDIVPLPDGVLVPGTMPAQKTVKYYQFDLGVSNATQLLFMLTNIAGSADLIVKRDWPPPTPAEFESGSFNPGEVPELVFVTAEDGQSALKPGRWFIGVLNRDTNSVTFQILASTLTNGEVGIVPVFSGQTYQATNTGGIGATDYYRFVVSPGAQRAHFELLSPSAEMALIARRAMLPMYGAGLFDLISDQSGTNDEIIVLFANAGSVRLTPGEWYIGAVSLSPGPVTYQFRALEWFEPGTNLVVGSCQIQGSDLCLSWNSLPGVRYVVEGTPSLPAPYWTNVTGVILATNTHTTACIGLPSPYHFFRVREARPD